MKKLLFLIPLCFGIRAQTSHRFGAIDGVSIPDKVWNVTRESAVATYLGSHAQQPSDAEIQSIQEQRVCAGLTNLISHAATVRANREFGIFASAEEIEARRQKAFASDSNWKANQAYYRERLEALVAGLSAVYDQGKDPQQVYQQLVAPHNVQQSDWAQTLYLGKNKEHRQKLVNDLAAATPEGFAKAEANYDPRPAVENEKLSAALDAMLAANDPKFKAYLNQWNANTVQLSPNHGRTTNVSASVKEYLDQKRGLWWQAERAKVSVSLSDPSLYAACQLSAMGVTVPGH